MAPNKQRQRRRGKQGTHHTEPPAPTKSPPSSPSATADAVTKKLSNDPPNDDLILTSSRRRGVYECDSCHTDISQVPRIRCAVCTDFDLCLDCFVSNHHHHNIPTTTTTAATASGSSSNNNTAADTSNHHDYATHGYRVCTSTRFPLFPALRNVPEQQQDSSSQKNSNDTQQQQQLLFVQLQAEDRSTWTAEEDLRLLEGIQMHGLGNWTEIAEVVSGAKTAKRCMERYLDDYLGRYGHILPPYTLLQAPSGAATNTTTTTSTTNTNSTTKTASDKPEDNNNNSTNINTTTTTTSAANVTTSETADAAALIINEETPRTSKRRAAFMRSPSAASSAASLTNARKRFRVIPTDEEAYWPSGHVPVNKNKGQYVNRDLAVKAEQAYCRAAAACETPEQLQALRQEWTHQRLLKPGGPTVLPMRPDDLPTLPGAELAGYMPRRGDLDVEWENDAEVAVADMEFLPHESAQDKLIKLQVLNMYNSKLEEREKRKQFILQRRLYQYREQTAALQKLPRDERDLVHRMRLFERFHTRKEHQAFLETILRAKRLRKEIAKLQTYRRIGIVTLAEAEKYELDKARHAHHKAMHLQKEKAAAAAAAAPAAATVAAVAAAAPAPEPPSVSLWKQYRDRKTRKSINRGGPSSSSQTVVDSSSSKKQQQQQQQNDDNEGDDSGKNEKDSPKSPPAGATKDKDGDTVMKDAPKQQPDSNKEEASTEKAMIAAMDTKPPAVATATTTTTTAATTQEDTALAHLLSKRERKLCQTSQLTARQYLEIKKVLIQETAGLVDGHRRQQVLVKVDTERRGPVMDFLVQAGWVSSTVVAAAQQEK